MRPDPGLAVVLRRPALALAAASSGPVCAPPAAAVLAGLTTAPTGVIHPWPDPEKQLPPLFPTALARR